MVMNYMFTDRWCNMSWCTGSQHGWCLQTELSMQFPTADPYHTTTERQKENGQGEHIERDRRDFEICCYEPRSWSCCHRRWWPDEPDYTDAETNWVPSCWSSPASAEASERELADERFILIAHTLQVMCLNIQWPNLFQEEMFVCLHAHGMLVFTANLV